MIDIVTNPAMPLGKVLMSTRPIVMHPRDFVSFLVETDLSLSYAQRSVMHAIIRRTWNQRPGMVPTFDALLKRVRHLDGVRP